MSPITRLRVVTALICLGACQASWPRPNDRSSSPSSTRRTARRGHLRQGSRGARGWRGARDPQVEAAKSGDDHPGRQQRRRQARRPRVRVPGEGLRRSNVRPAAAVCRVDPPCIRRTLDARPRLHVGRGRARPRLIGSSRASSASMQMLDASIDASKGSRSEDVRKQIVVLMTEGVSSSAMRSDRGRRDSPRRRDDARAGAHDGEHGEVTPRVGRGTGFWTSARARRTGAPRYAAGRIIGRRGDEFARPAGTLSQCRVVYSRPDQLIRLKNSRSARRGRRWLARTCRRHAVDDILQRMTAPTRSPGRSGSRSSWPRRP